jgi:uncharacterized RDD family membrane protein YckC
VEPRLTIDEMIALGMVPPGTSPGIQRRYAKFVHRFCAFVLDYLICIIVFTLGAIAAHLVSAPLGRLFDFGYLAYFGLLDATGGTLGKRAFGIRAIDEAGNAPGLWRGFLRHPILAVYTAAQLVQSVAFESGNVGFALGSSLLGLVVWLGCFVASIIDALWMLDDPQRQTLHDKIAGTYVVQF